MSKKNTTASKGTSYGKYLIAGILMAGIIFAVIKLTGNKEENQRHEWSYEVDSAFVMNCVGKYSKEFGQDTVKRQYAIEFCLCMLDKVKSKYSEDEMNNVTDAELKEWDRVCRNQLNYRGNTNQNKK